MFDTALNPAASDADKPGAEAAMAGGGNALCHGHGINPELADVKLFEIPMSGLSALLINCFNLLLFVLFRPTFHEAVVMLVADALGLLVAQWIDRKLFAWLFPDAFIYLEPEKYPQLKDTSLEQRMALFRSMVKYPGRRARQAVLTSILKVIPGSWVIVFYWKHQVSNAQQFLLLLLFVAISWSYFAAIVYIEKHAMISKRIAEFHQKHDWSEVFRRAPLASNWWDSLFNEAAGIVSIWAFLVLVQWQIIVRTSTADTGRTALNVTLVNILGLALLTRIWYLGRKFFTGGLRQVFLELDNIDLESTEPSLPLHSASELAYFEKAVNSLSDKLRAYKLELSRWVFFQAEESRYRALGELSALIVHDLSAPLHVIHFCTQQLQENPELINNPRYLDQLAVNGTRSLELISSLKAYLKGGSFKSTGVTYEEAHQQVLRLLETQFSTHWFQRVRIEVDSGLPPVRLDIPRADLIHVLFNILRNSLDNLFQSAHPEPRIQVSLQEITEREATVNLADNGSGLSVERFEELTAFEYFPQPHQQRREGLGLRLVRRLVERNGGSLVALPPPEGRSGALLQLKLLVFGFSSELAEDKGVSHVEEPKSNLDTRG